jgi:23S rRNA pseudouridine1911/1915/1917 synthase
MAVREGGREALTHWEVLERYSGTDGAPVASLLACRLETGRTHQIRVTLPRSGTRCWATTSTGPASRPRRLSSGRTPRTRSNALGRQALHAYLLTIEHPSQGKELAFRSELPGDLRRLRHSLGAQGTPA